MILGHLAIASIAKRKFLAENFAFLLVVSYGPDLVDKTLNLACNVPTRGAGHSLLIFVLLIAAALLLCQRFRINTQLLYIGVILWSSHLITDLVEPEIFLWPFLGHLPVNHHHTLMEILRNYYLIRVYPVQFFLEISLIMIAMLLWIFYALRSRLRSPA